MLPGKEAPLASGLHAYAELGRPALSRAWFSLWPRLSPQAAGLGLGGLVVPCTPTLLSSFAPPLPIPWVLYPPPTFPAWQPCSELCPCLDRGSRTIRRGTRSPSQAWSFSSTVMCCQFQWRTRILSLEEWTSQWLFKPVKVVE